jgi:TolB-like protein/Tfp pilus assembly protein PilF
MWSVSSSELEQIERITTGRRARYITKLNNRMYTLPEGMRADEVLAIVEKISKSPGFAGQDRLKRFLKYLVSETLNGRSDKIKSYCIALEVFDRPESFDPQKDSIVRIEATRLRRELEHYYLTDGVRDEIVIAVPKGGYVPTFTRAAIQQSSHENSPSPDTALYNRSRLTFRFVAGALIVGIAIAAIVTPWFRSSVNETILNPTLLVTPVVDLTKTDATSALARGLTESIVDRLARYQELAVVVGESTEQQPSATAVPFELSGTFLQTSAGNSIRLRLLNRQDGSVLWSESYRPSKTVQDFLDAELDIANNVASSLAEPTGVILEAIRSKSGGNQVRDWTDFECVLNAYAYRQALPSKQYPIIKRCLERAVENSPNSSIAWALLSLTYLDSVRFAYSVDGNASLTAAYEAAQRAVDLDSTSIRAQEALMMTLFFQKQYDVAIEVGRQALLLNPNDLELRGELGFRLALSGQWDDGCKLIKSALESSLRQRPYYLTALSICYLFEGKTKEAAHLIVQADAAGNPLYHIWALMILHSDQQFAEAARHRIWLKQNAQSRLPSLVYELPFRLGRRQDQEKVLELLRQVGLSAS